MKLEDFISELRQLKDEPKPDRRMKIQFWRRSKGKWFTRSLLSMALGGSDRDDLWAALYDRHAASGSKPLLSVPLRSETDISQLVEGQEVIVYGSTEVGHALLIRAGDRIIQPVGPAERVRLAPLLA